MNAAHFHLIFNHVPVFSLFFGLLVLALGMIQKQTVLKTTGLTFVVLGAFLVLPVNASGEEAEEMIEELRGRSHTIIHEHEEAAEIALWLMVLTGALATGALLMIKRANPRAHLLTTVTLGSGVLVFIWMMQVANLGGRISHPEIRPGYQVPQEETLEPSRGQAEVFLPKSHL